MGTKAELKVLSKDEQKLLAKDILKRYPKAHKVIVASDGQAFIADVSDAAAKNHSKVNRYGKELKLETFTRDDFESQAEGDNKKKALEVIALIEAAETAEAVNELVAGDTRATVVSAASKKLETFKSAE